MRRLGHSPRFSRPFPAAAALLSAVVLTGCAGGTEPLGEEHTFSATGSGENGGQTAAPASTPQSGAVGTTGATTSQPPRTTPPSDTAPTTAGQPDRGESCDVSGTRVADTAFAPYTAAHRVPVTGDGDTFYSFDVADNRFDPCAELSWLVLTGSLTNAGGTGGTGGLLGDAVVFFNGDQLITEPQPFMTRSVESVQRTGEDTVRVVHGHQGGAAAEGVTGTYPSTHTWNGSSLDSDITQLPAEMQQNPVRIDVAAPPVDVSGGGEDEVSQTLVAGQYKLPIADGRHLLCDIGHVAGPVADCYADFPTTWKMPANDRPQATRIIFTDDPPHVRGTPDPTPTGSRAEAYGDVPGDTTLAVGEATVDLTEPEQATISSPEGAILITPDSYEVLGPSATAGTAN